MQRRVLVLIVVCAAGAAAIFLYSIRTTPGPPRHKPAETDPRRTYSGPYRNVSPDVKYVGDAACTDCHREIAKKYAGHPMGRAMAPAGAADAAEQYGPEAHNPFEKNGYHYRVERRGGKVYHVEERRDDAGKPVAATECEAAFAVGSGTRGKSYLVRRGDFLFQSPISWFSEKGIWDLSPGFAESLHFNRPVAARCLVCHSNFADAVDGPLNRYREPIFRGYVIGCERCHGPGDLHVQRQAANENYTKPDDTIVNPKKLDLVPRDAVCEQCHLQGEERVLRRGRDTFDFRPGLPLHDVWSVFTRLPELNPNPRSVGQVEQMHQSRCFQGSAGKLGCISCHDPHERPAAGKPVEFYRGRCLTCHETKGCTVPIAERKKRQSDDSCIACHMSKAGSSNIPHTAVTDHRVPRRPDASPLKTPRPVSPGEVPIVHFHRTAPGVDSKAMGRDLGIALAALTRDNAAAASQLTPLAIPLLEEATKAFPNDERAWEALGMLLRTAGRPDDAAIAYEKALALKPDLEGSLTEAAATAMALGQTDVAIGYWQRATAVNPWVPRYYFELARRYAERRDWSRVVAACDEAIKLEPIGVDARAMRLTGLIRLGEMDKAKAEYAVLLRMRPPNLADLKRVFEPQLK